MVDNENRLERDARYGLSGLTEAEASEFHGYFTRSFLAFTALAIVAHFLVWLSAPWGV